MVDFLIEVAGFLATVIAAGVGAWLSVRFFPLKAKQDEWQWKKQIEAQELLFNTLSEISFVSHNYLKGEYLEEFSMSNQGMEGTETIVFDGVKLLHQRSAALSLVLSKKQNQHLSEFLDKTQSALDEARQSHGQWDQDDSAAEEQHSNDTIGELGVIAKSTLSDLKETIASV